MSGSRELPDELCWMPAGWVYDDVLDRLAQELETELPAISHMLLQAKPETNGGYLDLIHISVDELLALERAAERAYERLEMDGPSCFSVPSFYAGLASQF